MKNYEVKKSLLKGVTYDEVFCELRDLLSTVKNGWDFAKVFSELYLIAKNRNKDMFIGVIETELFDNIYCFDTFEKVMLSIYTKKAGLKSKIRYYKISFQEDAFLDELKEVPNTMTRKLLNTVMAYYETNSDVLEDEESLSVYEQICHLEKMLIWELKYTPEQIFMLEKANKVAREASIEVERISKEFKEHKIDKDTFERKNSIIEEALCEVWLNKENDGSRTPIYLEDLEIPNNLKNLYDNIFIDF